MQSKDPCYQENGSLLWHSRKDCPCSRKLRCEEGRRLRSYFAKRSSCSVQDDKGSAIQELSPARRSTSCTSFRNRRDRDRCGRFLRCRVPLAARVACRRIRPCVPGPVRDASCAGRLLRFRPPKSRPHEG